MQIVILTALGVGGATIIGSLIGFIFKNISQTFSDVVLSFAAGVMMAASVLGLILPALEYGGAFAPVITVVGIFSGALCLNLLDRLLPYLRKIAGIGFLDKKQSETKINRVLLFVMAIAIHNFPEGLAAGVGFGSGNTLQALTVAGGIALQNIPEGMVIISPMLASGISPTRTFLCAMLTGIVEIIGTFAGFFAVNAVRAFLPYALSFAGGTMLYVISGEMIPQTQLNGNERIGAFSLLIGFCLMVVIDFYMK